MDFEFDEPDADGVEANAEAVPASRDPGRVAFRLLLERCICEAKLTIDKVGHEGTVVVLRLPSSAWTGLAKPVWTELVKSGRPSTGARWERIRGAGWSAWAAKEAPSKTLAQDEAKLFADSLWRGRHCFGAAEDLGWLPADLVCAADYRLDLPVLDVDTLFAVADAVTGTPVQNRSSFIGSEFVTPRQLRLARRINQTADEYLEKLSEIIRRDSKPVTSKIASPRATPTLARLHGMDEAVDWGKALATDLNAYRSGALPWSAVDSGCLLSGPPGCGKTLFARALAETCGAVLVTGGYGEWLGTGLGHQGDLLRSMRKAFADAKAQAPAILFVDEVDSFPDRGSVKHAYADWETQVVNALLSEIDGVSGREGVVLLAACNHPNKLDAALIRSGRLDRHIRIGLPDHRALEQILREHLGDESEGIDLNEIARAADGATGADCERIVRGARRRARCANRGLTVADLLVEVCGIDGRSAEERWNVAVHEAGHAVVASVLGTVQIRSVSVIAADGHGGGMICEPKGSTMTPGQMRGHIATLLAGRAAEEVVIGVASSGAGGSRQSDLARATSMAVAAIASYGFDVSAGLVWRGEPNEELVTGLLTSDVELSGRVKSLLSECHGNAVDIVGCYAEPVRAVANALLDNNVISGLEVMNIIRKCNE